MNDNEIARIVKRWATPDEAFREELLQQCLAELGKAEEELDDDALDMLAAAGNPYAAMELGIGD